MWRWLWMFTVYWISIAYIINSNYCTMPNCISGLNFKESASYFCSVTKPSKLPTEATSRHKGISKRSAWLCCLLKYQMYCVSCRVNLSFWVMFGGGILLEHSFKYENSWKWLYHPVLISLHSERPRRELLWVNIRSSLSLSWCSAGTYGLLQAA